MLQEIQNIMLEEINDIKNESEFGTSNKLDHTAEIIVSMPKNLGERQRADLIIALNDDAGTTAAEFCPLRYHLILVRYHRDLFSSQDMLDRITSQYPDARLIGLV